MPNFEDIQNKPKTPEDNQMPKQEQSSTENELNSDQILETLNAQKVEEQETLREINETLPDIEGLLAEVKPDETKDNTTEHLSGIMSRLGQTLRDSKLAKVAVLTIGLLGPSSALAQPGAWNDKESTFKNIPTVSAKQNFKKFKEQSGYNSLDAVLKAVKTGKSVPAKDLRMNLKQQTLGHYKSGELASVPAEGRIIYNKLDPTQQSNLINPYNNMKTKNYLPGATINGKPAYEIAPGVYGNENSRYGNGVEMGTIHIE